MIFPLITAFPVSQSSDGELSGESFISIKNANSCLIMVVKSGSSSSEVLKRSVVDILVYVRVFIEKNMNILLVRGCSLSNCCQGHSPLIYCFIVSVECQFLELPEVLERSIMGLRTVLKSPAMMRLFEFDNMEKRLWKKDSSSLSIP